jgi:hypothetical protein
MADEETEDQAAVPGWLPGAKAGLTLLALGAAAPSMPAGVQSAAVALGILPAFLEYIQDAPGRAWSRLKAATDEAVDVFGDDPEQLLARIRSNDRLLWLFDTTVDAAARASTKQKARALGRALAEGALASDDSRLDQAALMTRILSDVEPIDIRVVALLSDLRHGRNVPPEDVAVPASNGFPACLYGDDLAGLAGLDAVVVDGPIGVLRRHGLIAEGVIDANRGAAWCITDLGDRLLDYLQREDHRDRSHDA